MRYTFISDTPAGHQDALDAYSQAVTFVAERLSPSVANLRLSRRVRGGRAPGFRVESGGSGVVITNDGFVLTCAHVVAAMTGRGRASFSDGSELSFELVGADDAARDAFVDRLKLFGIGYSWGGYESLAIPVDPYRTVSKPPALNLVRLHIGLEDPEDLIKDLGAALSTL